MRRVPGSRSVVPFYLCYLLALVGDICSLTSTFPGYKRVECDLSLVHVELLGDVSLWLLVFRNKSENSREEVITDLV